jgi:hypothetical protein
VKTWNVSVPPGTTSFRFPDLPASLAPLVPGAGTKLFGLEVSALSSSEIDGPADFRQHHVLRAGTHAVLPTLSDVTLATVRKQQL